jgi:GDP-L-fucose synthase
VTGGRGFVGAHIVRYLARRHEVLAPTSVELDLLDHASVDRAFASHGFDVVIHAAVRGGSEVLAQTLTMQGHLLRQRSRWGRLIWLGSGAEFAKHRDISEERLGEEVPRDGYGLAKLFCTLASRGDRAILNLRLFGVFGPGEGYLFKFISNAIVKGLLGDPIRIRQDTRFSYLWIEDLLPILDQVLEMPAPDVQDVNVVPDERPTLVAIAEWIRSGVARIAGKSVEIQVEAPGMNREYSAANDRLRRLLPSVRFTPMDEAVRSLTSYYQGELQRVDVDALRTDEYAKRIVTRSAP